MTKKLIKKLLIAFIVISVCFIIQSTLFYRGALAYGTPDIMLILSCSWGFMRKEREGMLVGLFSGLLMDLFSETLFGFYMLIFLFMGYICGLFSESYYSDDIKLPITLITICDFVYHMYIYIIIFLLKGDLNLGLYFKTIILPSACYTLIISLILYTIFHYFNKKWIDSDRKVRKTIVWFFFR